MLNSLYFIDLMTHKHSFNIRKCTKDNEKLYETWKTQKMTKLVHRNSKYSLFIYLNMYSYFHLIADAKFIISNGPLMDRNN